LASVGISKGQKINGDEMMTKAQTYIEKKLNEKISVELQNSLWAEEILTEGY